MEWYMKRNRISTLETICYTVSVLNSDSKTQTKTETNYCYSTICSNLNVI